MAITDTTISDDLMLHIVSNVILMLFILMIIIYLNRRDEKKLDVLDARYDKLIVNMLNTITKQQDIYKNEIISDIRELSGATFKVMVGIEKVVEGVKEVEKEVNRVTDESSNINSGISLVVGEVSKVVEQLKLSATAAEHLEKSVNEISGRLDKMINLEEIRLKSYNTNIIDTNIEKK